MGAALLAAQGPNSVSLLDPFGVCTACRCGDVAEWVACGDEETSGSSSSRSGSRPMRRDAAAQQARGGRRRQPTGAAASLPPERLARRIEELTLDLFNLHDLNGNGLLEEQELVQLNERIAVLHHGTAANTHEVRSKYRDLFRAKLDPHGRPVPFEKFRRYAVEFLNGLDPDPEAQEMMLEQFVAEAHSGRKAMDFWHEGGGAVDLLSDLTEQAVAAPRHQAGGTRSSYGVTLERRAAPRAVWPAGPPVSADLLGFGHSLSADARAGAAKDSSDAPLTESRERCEWPLLHADDVQVGAAVAAVPAALPATALAALQSQNLGGGRLRSTLV